MTPDNKFVVLGDANSNISVFNLETKSIIHTIEKAHKDWVTGLAVSSDGKTLISVSLDKSVSKWDLSTMERKQTLENAHTGMR